MEPGTLLLTYTRVKGDEFHRALALCSSERDEVRIGRSLNPFTPHAQRRRLTAMETGR
jgi:hypothetical protein